jgi:MFS family permease
MGLGFGTVRVTSATITLFGQNDPKLTRQRSGIYNTALSIGQIIGPWVGGLAAGLIGLSATLIGLPGVFLLFYGIAAFIIARLQPKCDLSRGKKII